LANGDVADERLTPRQSAGLRPPLVAVIEQLLKPAPVARAVQTIRAYIQNEKKEDRRLHQLNFWR
jgi:hypothetical protein